MDDGTKFRSIVAGSDRLKARFHAVTDKMVTVAEEALGVVLTTDDLIALPSLRIAVISADAFDQETFLKEAQKLERVQNHVKNTELKAALKAGEKGALDELNKLNRADRISRARTLGLESTSAAAPPADRETLLVRCLSLPYTARVAFARQHGLI